MAITHAVLGGTPALCSGDLCGSSQLGNRTPFGRGPCGSRPSVGWSSTAHGDAELFQICTMGTNLEDLRRASTSCIGKSLERFFSAYMVFLNLLTDIFAWQIQSMFECSATVKRWHEEIPPPPATLSWYPRTYNGMARWPKQLSWRPSAHPKLWQPGR